MLQLHDCIGEDQMNYPNSGAYLKFFVTKHVGFEERSRL